MPLWNAVPAFNCRASVTRYFAARPVVQHASARVNGMGNVDRHGIGEGSIVARLFLFCVLSCVVLYVSFLLFSFIQFGTCSEYYK